MPGRGLSDSFGDQLNKIIQMLGSAMMSFDASPEDQAFLQSLQSAIIEHTQAVAAAANPAMGTAGMGIQSGTGTGSSVSIPGETMSRAPAGGMSPENSSGMTEEISRVLAGS